MTTKTQFKIQKELLPFTHRHFLQLKELHKEAVARFKKNPTTIFSQQVHDLTEKIFEYENVVLYNKHAVTHCKFGYSIDTEEVCEGFFKNTLRHFTIHGNCCQSCSNYFSACIKPKKDDVTVDEIIKQDIDNIKTKMGEFLTKLKEERESEKFKELRLSTQ